MSDSVEIESVDKNVAVRQTQSLKTMVGNYFSLKRVNGRWAAPQHAHSVELPSA